MISHIPTLNIEVEIAFSKREFFVGFQCWGSSSRGVVAGQNLMQCTASRKNWYYFSEIIAKVAQFPLLCTSPDLKWSCSSQRWPCGWWEQSFDENQLIQTSLFFKRQTKVCTLTLIRYATRAMPGSVLLEVQSSYKSQVKFEEIIPLIVILKRLATCCCCKLIPHWNFSSVNHWPQLTKFWDFFEGIGRGWLKFWDNDSVRNSYEAKFWRLRFWKG